VYLSASLRYSYDTLAGPKLLSSISNLLLLLCSCVDFDSLYVAKAEEEEEQQRAMGSEALDMASIAPRGMCF
jgi:hypothetical protein